MLPLENLNKALAIRKIREQTLVNLSGLTTSNLMKTISFVRAVRPVLWRRLGHYLTMNSPH